MASKFIYGANGSDQDQRQIPEAVPENESSHSQERQCRRRPGRNSFLARMSRHMIFLRRRDRNIPRRRASFSGSFSSSPVPGSENDSFTASSRRSMPDLADMSVHEHGGSDADSDGENQLSPGSPILLEYPHDSPIMVRIVPNSSRRRSNTSPSVLQRAEAESHEHDHVWEPNFDDDTHMEWIPPYPRARPYPNPSNVATLPGSMIDVNDPGRRVNRDSRWPAWTSIKVKLRSMFSRRDSEDEQENESDRHRQENIEQDAHSFSMDAREFSDICTANNLALGCTSPKVSGDYAYRHVEYCIPKKICKVINCCWYWGDINICGADEVLKDEVDGVFLLRRSTHPKFLFTISFKRNSKTWHLRIETGYYNVDDSPAAINDPLKFSPTYSRLLNLIDISGEHHAVLCAIPLLSTPLPRKAPHTLKELARAAIYNHVEYNNIKKLPIPGELKIYIKEFRYKVRKYKVK